MIRAFEVVQKVEQKETTHLRDHTGVMDTYSIRCSQEPSKTNTLNEGTL